MWVAFSRHRIVLALGCLLLSVLTAACGEEKGRVPFQAAGTGRAAVPLEAGDVSFWTDIDIEYEGAAGLEYQIELSQGGAPVARASCNPLGRINTKVTWVETNIGDAHSRSGMGKMNCSASVPASTQTTVNVTLAFSQRPAKLELDKADLVLKQ